MINSLKQYLGSAGSVYNNREKVFYIVINILVNALAFLKSFIFMKYLGLYELGILTVIQTIMLSIGLLQLGFINGGYRIYSTGIEDESDKVNNQVFTYIIILASLLLVAWLFMLPLKLDISVSFILSGLVLGILSLLSNWLTNVLIAKQNLGKLNRYNISSSILSLLFLPLVYWFKVAGALIVLFIQPAAFILIVLIYQKFLRPTFLLVNWALIGKIMKYGFIPFLTGIFTLLTNQVERWSILGWLNTISLGKFYLVFLFSTFFVLLPGSLNNIYFPNTMKLYREQKFQEIRHSLKRYYFYLGLYIFAAVILTLLFLRPLVNWLLPLHNESVGYVFLVLPGLILITLTDPIGLLFNASVILKPMFWAYFSSVLLYIILVVLFFLRDQLSLKLFAVLRSITGCYIFIFFLLSYMGVRKRIWSYS